MAGTVIAGRVPLGDIARLHLLPRLAGFVLAEPGPRWSPGRDSVLVYRTPIGHVLVGVRLLGAGEREVLADYVAMPLFTPTVEPIFQPVGMEMDRFPRNLRRRRWVLGGHDEARILERLARFVVEEGIPVLRRRADVSRFADEIEADPHELESSPIATEQAAYARILAGQVDRATELLGLLVAMKGRGLPGQAEITPDEMEVLKERSRRTIRDLRQDPSRVIGQLDRWRRTRLDDLALDGD